jgi:NADH-quinone oxidoreductase subunit M
MLILLGAFKERPVLGAVSFAAIVFVLVYGLRMIQDTIFGHARHVAPLPDLTPREVAILAPLAAAVVVLGLYPGPVLDLVQEPVQRLVDEWDKVMIASRTLNP